MSALLPVAHLSRVSGKTVATSDVKKGDDVYWDDVLKTEKGGRARLTLTDGSILSLGSQAELKVLKHDANSQQTSLELQYGRVRAEVNKVTQMGGSFTVKTPTAVAGVIGTDFATESGVSSTQFVCLSGNVSIGSADPSITDKVNCLAGQVVTVEKGKAPSQPVPATVQQLQQVINDTEPGIISAVTPSLLAPGTTVDAIATGAHLENLTNASVTGDGVQVSIASAPTAGSMTLHLVVASSATPGPRTVTLTGTNPTPTIAVFQVVTTASFAQLLNDALQSAVGGLNGLVVGLQQTEQLALQQLQSSGIKTVDLINLKSQMDAQVKVVVDAAAVAANGDKSAEATASATYTTLADAARAALLQRNPAGTPDDAYNQALSAAFTQVNGPMMTTFAANQENVGRLLQNANTQIASELSNELQLLGVQAGGLGLLGEVSTDLGNSVTISATGRAGNGTNYSWGLCAAGTAGNCTPIAGQTSTSTDFVVDTCSLQPGDYRANLNFTLASGSPTTALYLLHVLPDNSTQPIDILNGLAGAYMNLQTQGVMNFFDQTQFSNYTELQENVRKTFAELTSMTINVLPLSNDTKCNTAALRASWNQNYSFKTNPSIVFQQQEQLTVRLQRTPGKGWLITELQGDNGTLQGNPPGPVGSADSGAKPDLDITNITTDEGHGNFVPLRGRAVRPNTFSGQLPPLTPGSRTYHITFTNTSQLALTQSVSITVEFTDANGAVLLTQNAMVTPPLAPGASETVDIPVTIPSSLAGQKVQLVVIVNPGCSSVISTCDGTFTQTQTVGTVDLGLSNLHTTSAVAAGQPVTFAVTVQNFGTLTSQNATIVINSADFPSLIATGTVGPIAPGGSATVNLNMTLPSTTGAHTFKAALSPAPAFDTNSANDSTTVQLQFNATTVVTVSGGPFTYDGNAHAATCSAASGNQTVNGSCTFTYNGNAAAPTNAGTYAVVAAFTSSNPNFGNATGNGSLTINKATPTVTVTGGTFNFDGNSHSSTCSVAGVGGAAVSGSCAVTYNGASAAPSAAGTYNVIGSFTSADNNYANATGSSQIVINPAGSPTVTVGGGPFTYDGNPHSATCSATGTGNVNVPGSCAFTYNGSSTPPTNAGTYAVVANFTSSNPAFTNSTGSGSLVIDKATPHVAVTGGTFNFDGNPHAATCSVTGVNNAPVNGTCAITYNGGSAPPVNSGTYSVAASFTSSDNNYNNASGSGTITIGSGGTPTVTVSGGPFTYDGNPHAAQCSATSVNTQVSGTCAFTYNGNSTPPTNAGSYAVVAQFTSSNSNFGNSSGSGTLVINKATPTVTVSGGPFTFDSNPHSASCSAKGVNNATVSGSCTFTYNGGSTAPTAVGNYAVVASFTSSDANYNNATGNGTMIISAVGSIAVTVSGGPFTYDGNPHSATCSATANNANVPGSCTFTYNGSSTPPTNAGGYAVVANFTPSSNNFSPATGGGSITINKATPTITVTGGPFTYDGNSHSATCTATGVNNAPVSGGCALTYGALTAPLITGMRPNRANTVAPSGEINAGSYSVSADFTSSDNNYTNGNGTGTMTINQATPTVTVSGGPFMFDGNTHAATCSASGVNNAVVSGGCSFTYGGNPAAQSAAGTYAVVASFTSADPNYANATGNGSITINKATPTITVSGGPFPFDGNTHSATCTANGVGNFVVPGNCALTYNGSSAAPSAAGTYTVAAAFTSSDNNYNNATGNGSMTINAASTPFVSVSGGPFTYDGTPHSASCSATFGGQPVAGSCTFVYNGFPTPPTNAGSYNVVATFTPTSQSFTTGSGNATMVINQAQTTTAVATSNSSVSVGTPVTFTATLSVTAPGAGSPTGSVTFKDGTNTIGVGTVSGGTASVTTSGLSAGAHSITALYGGDNNFAGSNSTAIAENVGLLTPTVAVSGGPFPYDGTQHSASCSATGAGNVAVSGSCTFTYNGNAATPSAAGTYTVVASFTSSDPSYGNGTGNGSITINKAALTITASSASVIHGAPAPTITAGFSGFVNSETSAVLTAQPTCGSGYTTSTNVGTAVVSSCSGATAANYNIGYVNGAVTITQAQTTTAVATSNATVTSGSPVTFTATLAVTAPGTGSPTGTVTFKDGTSALGTGTVTSGTASFSTSSLSTGSHSITAVYGGDTNFAASTSSALTETVTSAVIDFTPTSLASSFGGSNIQVGESSVVVAVDNNGNHNNGTFAISLACGSGGPSGSVSGASIPPKGGSSTYSIPIPTSLSTGSYSCTVSLTSLPGGTTANSLNAGLTVVDFTLVPFSPAATMVSGRTASFTGVTVTPSNYPLSLSLSFTNPPTGLSVNSTGLSGTAGAVGSGTTGVSATVHGVTKTSSFAWNILAEGTVQAIGTTNFILPQGCSSNNPIRVNVKGVQYNATGVLGTLPAGFSSIDPMTQTISADATVTWNIVAGSGATVGNYDVNATFTDSGIPSTNTPPNSWTVTPHVQVVGPGTAVCPGANIGPADSGTNVGLDPSSISFSPSLPKTGDTVEVRFRLSNTGSGDAHQVPVALRANGTIVAQDTFDVAAGKNTIAGLQWDKASNVVSETRTGLRSNALSSGSRMKLEVVVDPLNTMTQQSVNVTRVASVSNFMLSGGETNPNVRGSLQRVMLEVTDGGCAGLRFDSGATGTCDSGDVAIAVQDLGSGRFLLNANNGVSDLGSGTVAIQDFSSVPFSPNATAVAGHTYAVQLRDGSVGQLTIQSIRNPHRLTVKSGKLFRGGQATKSVKTLGGSTDAPSTGDTSGGSTRSDNSVFFDVVFGAKAQ